MGEGSERGNGGNEQNLEISLISSSSARSRCGYLFYWHIHQGGKRAGKAYINLSQDGFAFISVFINKTMQGRGIGSAAFRSACELSGLSAVYAEVRRSNIPSQKALRKAGFIPFGRNSSGEDILVWKNSAHMQ